MIELSYAPDVAGRRSNWPKGSGVNTWTAIRWTFAEDSPYVGTGLERMASDTHGGGGGRPVTPPPPGMHHLGCSRGVLLISSQRDAGHKTCDPAAGGTLTSVLPDYQFVTGIAHVTPTTADAARHAEGTLDSASTTTVPRQRRRPSLRNLVDFMNKAAPAPTNDYLTFAG